MFRMIAVLGFGLALAYSALAQDWVKQSPFARASAGEADVLRAIDNICADTWCEGDFNFAFTKAEFLTQENATRVHFALFPWEQEEVAAKHTCLIKGFAAAERILEEHDLNWQFYEALGACIQDAEEAYRASQGAAE